MTIKTHNLDVVNTVFTNHMKLMLIVVINLFSVSMIYQHTYEQIYPIVNILMFVSLVVIAISVLYGKGVSKVALLTAIVFVSVAYRLLMFDLMPVSGGIDGEWFAAQTYTVLSSGNTNNIASGFYQNAAAYPVLLAIVSKITNSTVASAMVIVPLSIGITSPLFAWVYTDMISSSSRQWQYLAAIIASVTTFSLYHSWLAIAQSTTIPIFLSGLLSLFYIRSTENRAPIFLTLISGLSLTVMHKLTIILFVISVVGSYILSYVKAGNRTYSRSISYSLVSFLVVLSLIQVSILTNHLQNISIFVMDLLMAFGGGDSSTVSYTAAYDPKSGLIWTLATGANMIGLLAVAAIGWLYGLQKWWQYRSPLWEILLPTTGVCVGVGIVMTIVGIPTRGLMVIEPVLAVLVVVALALLYSQQTTRKRSLVAVLLLVVIATQSFALIGLADHPSQPDRSIPTSELVAKDFALEHTDEQPYTDSRYALHMTDPTEPESRYQVNWLDEQLLNKSIDPNTHSTVLFRNKKVYNSHLGWYQLSWSPNQYLDAKYNRVYHIGNVNLYKSASKE